MPNYYIVEINKNLKKIKDKDTREEYKRMFQKSIVTGQDRQLLFINNQINMILDIQKAGINHEKGN